VAVIEVVLVPAADDMDDETMCKHINARHSEDHLTTVAYMPLALPSYMGSVRAFHARLHALATPGQYDHEHDEPSGS